MAKPPATPPGKHLVVVESPAKSRTLQRFLGDDYEIVSTVGHIIDLPKSKLGVDTDNNFAPAYCVIKGKEQTIAELKKAAKRAASVLLAPDPDREGEAIAWHVANELAGLDKPCRRITFNEITRSAVTRAVAAPREIDIDRVNAQQARRVLDRLVGYKVSPFLWKTIARNLSAGRVQSVALRLVCEREAEIAAFTPEEYWKFRVLLDTSSGDECETNLLKIGGQSLGKPGENGNKVVISSQADADRIVAELGNASFVVRSVKRTERERKPAAPFITSTLQQEASRLYGYSPRRTMSSAQKLYEGIEIGDEGSVGLITYMRTDSTRIADEALAAVREHIGAEYGADYLPDEPNTYGKGKQAQDAHEAIRPTHVELTPNSIKKNLTPQQFKVYQLIWNRFVASQMAVARFDVETVDIEAGQYLLRASAQRLKFDGFLRVYQETEDADENGNGKSTEHTLPRLGEGETLALSKVEPSQSFTKPPPRYSEATLVKRLEADGIGRPSTYAAILSTLRDRKYVELVDKRLQPTDLGSAVNGILVEHFPSVFNVAFTAEMERDLDEIEAGNREWTAVIREFYGPFAETISHLKGKEAEIKAALTETTDIACEKCGQPMLIKWGRNGRFLACSGWPDCRSTRPLPEEEERNRTDEKCEKCGADMVVKTGRFGRFLACSAYPDCRNTKALTLGISCPKEGCGGKVLEKTTRTRRVFYGCTNYPKCDFASWDRPVEQACPVCGNSWLVQKTSKVKGEFLRCPECKHEVTEQLTPERNPA